MHFLPKNKKWKYAGISTFHVVSISSYVGIIQIRYTGLGSTANSQPALTGSPVRVLFYLVINITLTAGLVKRHLLYGSSSSISLSRIFGINLLANFPCPRPFT